MTETPVQLMTEIDAETRTSSPDSPAALHWAFINGSKVEPQSDDRTPMFGAAAISAGSPSDHRSKTRRKHQAMYKEWSKNRHE